MREVLSLLINPIPFLYILLLSSLIFRISGRMKVSKLILWFAAIWFVAVSTRFIPVAMTRSLENRYSQIDEDKIRAAGPNPNIIVLGGGHSDERGLAPNNQLSTQALARLVEGIRIQKLSPRGRLILSGYKGRSELPQALVLYRTALILGADSASTEMQKDPANTRMEAESYASRHRDEPLIIVTSAAHMHRAMILFRKMGVNAIAAPADFLIKDGTRKNPYRFMPSSSYISMMQSAIHEYVGILWEKMGGK
jgi:uncharacterized SAM-binding protein YcdF (DUF218 family)